MTEFVMLVGLAGSGKNFIVENYYQDYVHISSDDIREEVFGDVNDQTHNAEVFNIMCGRTIQALKENKSCVYNATNLNAKKRINFLKRLSGFADVKKICVLNVPPYDVVKKRNTERDRVVPNEVLERMLRSFQPPHIEEGWDEIRIMGNTKTPYLIYEIVSKAMKVPHDNPHHTSTIGEHMMRAYNYAVERNLRYLTVCEAALVHDVGKLHCKSFSDYRGRKTRHAHYYSHDSVGAYIYLSYSDGDETALTVANLIAHHMDFFKGDKCLEKIRKTYGEEFYSMLLELHDADLAAH